MDCLVFSRSRFGISRHSLAIFLVILYVKVLASTTAAGGDRITERNSSDLAVSLREIHSSPDSAAQQIFNLFSKSAINQNVSTGFVEELENAISALLSSIPKPVVREVLHSELTRAAEFEGLPNPEHSGCDEDFSQPCPSGWIDLGDADCCIPPYSYFGECTKICTSRITPINRQKTARQCGVQWPADAACKKLDASSPPRLDKSVQHTETALRRIKSLNHIQQRENFKRCLDLWSSTGIVIYNGIERLKAACASEWPGYIYNFDSLTQCPMGWTPSGPSDCVAPKNYKGPCAKRQNFENFSLSQKQLVAAVCAVMWPLRAQKHEDLEAVQCPENWTLIDYNGTCAAPPSYTGNCSTKYNFKRYSILMKVLWSQMCKAPFQGQGNKSSTSPTSQELNKNKKVGILVPQHKENVIHHPIDIFSDMSGIRAFNNRLNILSWQAKRLGANDFDKAIQKSRNFASTFSGLNFPANGFKFLQKDYDQDFNSGWAEQAVLLSDNYLRQHCFERNYGVCPLGWEQMNERICEAPENYPGPCNRILDLGIMAKAEYKHTSLTPLLYQNIQELKNWEASCNAQFPCKDCRRDYLSSPCPNNWIPLGGDRCSAPSGYPDILKITCGSVVNFANTTPEFRERWSSVCGSDWPCQNQCERDYTAPCPKLYKAEGTWQHSYGKMSKCVLYQNRTDIQSDWCPSTIYVPYDIDGKKAVEASCKAKWLCLKKCNENFWQKCPYNWIYDNGNCIAQEVNSLPPDCPHEIRFNNNAEKSAFSQQFGVSWPCENNCQRDWRQKCPEHWKLNIWASLKGKVICTASSEYNGFCTPIQDLTSFTFQEKQDFAFRCEVAWPCGGKKRKFPFFTENPGWQTKKAYRDKASKRNTRHGLGTILQRYKIKKTG